MSDSIFIIIIYLWTLYCFYISAPTVSHLATTTLIARSIFCARVVPPGSSRPVRAEIRVALLLNTFSYFQFSFSSSVPATRTPQQHIDVILHKFAKTLNMRVEKPNNYVLKVCGREEYLFGDYPLIQFLYIQEMLSTDGVPQVMPMEMSQLMLTRELVLIYKLIIWLHGFQILFFYLWSRSASHKFTFQVKIIVNCLIWYDFTT